MTGKAGRPKSRGTHSTVAPACARIVIADVRALVERYGIHANDMRAAIDEADEAGDKDTADLFTEISRELDKDLWFLQAQLQERD